MPTLCEGLKTVAQDNGWKRIAKGTIAVIVDKNNPPKGIKVKRSLFKRHFSDMGVSTAEPIYENEDNLVVLVYEKLPLVKNDEVVFE